MSENENKDRGLLLRIQDVADEFCTDYCKYPDIWDAEKEGCELSESDHCQDCPLNRLYGSKDLHFQGEREFSHGFDQAKDAALDILNAELDGIRKRELSMVPDPMICASIGSQKAVVMRLIDAVKDIHKTTQCDA